MDLKRDIQLNLKIKVSTEEPDLYYSVYAIYFI